MKSRKTNQNKRDYYVYKHADGSSVTLNPGENGVTENTLCDTAQMNTDHCTFLKSYCASKN